LVRASAPTPRCSRAVKELSTSPPPAAPFVRASAPTPRCLPAMTAVDHLPPPAARLERVITPSRCLTRLDQSPPPAARLDRATALGWNFNLESGWDGEPLESLASDRPGAWAGGFGALGDLERHRAHGCSRQQHRRKALGPGGSVWAG